MNEIQPLEPTKKLSTKKLLSGIAIVIVVGLVLTRVPFIKRAIKSLRNNVPIATSTPPIGQTSQAEWGFFQISQPGNPLADLQYVKWSRITQLTWPETQNADGTYNWAFIDEKVQKAQKDGYGLVFVLKTAYNANFSESNCYNAIVANTDPRFIAEKHSHSCPLKPEYLPQWKTFVKAVIERYDADGNSDMPGLSKNFAMDVQFENEAGNQYYWHYGQADGKIAAQSLIEALKVIVEARDEANPSTKVVGPGLMQPDWIARCTANQNYNPSCNNAFNKRNIAFTQEFLKHPQYFDAIDVHYYNYFKFDPYHGRDGLGWMKAEMQKNGYQRPIYVLEWNGAILQPVVADGYADEFLAYFPYASDFNSQEAFIEMYKNLNLPQNKKYCIWFEKEHTKESPKLFTTMLAEGVQRMVNGRFADFPVGWENVWWNYLGIVRYEGTQQNPILIKKPDYYTYQLLEQKLYGFTGAEKLNLGNNIFAHKFSFNGRNPIIVAWTEGNPTNINLSSHFSGNVSITHIVTELDQNNNPIRPPDTNAPASAVPITDTPVFVE